ncbi:alpha/beta fold hydrolase [Geodermatophilus sp. URMC 65]
MHGGAAHSGWWHHVAPLLGTHRVVAFDLSGHGDSDRRADYGTGQWAREVLAVAAAEGLDRPVVLGHSMGGWVALTVGVEHGDEVAGVAVIDSPLDRQPPEEQRVRPVAGAAGVRRPRDGGGAVPHPAAAGGLPAARPRARGPRLACWR